MKRPLTIFGDLVLILAAVSCVIGALLSAFSFTVDTFVMTASWAVAALALSLHASIWRRKGLLILLIPILLLCIWKLPEIVSGAKWVTFYITTEFSKWLFVPILFAGAEATMREQTLFFTIFGIIVAFLLSIAICLRRSAFLTILFTAPIVFLTFVIVFNQSEPIYLLGLLAVYLTMLFSNGFFPDDFSKRSKAVFPALAIALVFMGIAYVLAPPESYNREDNIRNIDNQIRHFASRVGIARVKTGIGWPGPDREIWGFDTTTVEISDAGTRLIFDNSLIEVTVSRPGAFYLRGFSMQRFENGRWTVNSEHLTDDSLARGAPALMAHAFYRHHRDLEPPMVNIIIERTGDFTRNAVYTPYFSFPFRWNTTRYHFDFFHVEDRILELHSMIPPDSFPIIDLSDYGARVHRSDMYLQIEDSTAEGLRRIAAEAGIHPDADRPVITEQVAEFFSSFGRYTLSPFVIPEGEDFALYFLQISRQGYCIHYATTATKMLRSLGVPARFTSGFVVNVGPADVGRALMVTDRNAHAWVEVYYDDIGWLPLEVTPPSTGSGLPDGRPNPGIGSSFPQLEFDDHFDDEYFPDWMQDLDPSDGMGIDDGIGAAGGYGEQPGIPRVAGGILLGVLVAIALLSLLLRGSITRKNREKRFVQEDSNAAVVFAWRYLSRLSRLRRQDQLPKDLEEIALKARFSQHRLSEDERSAVTVYVKEFAAKVYQNRSWFGQFWIKCILGL